MGIVEDGLNRKRCGGDREELGQKGEMGHFAPILPFNCSI